MDKIKVCNDFHKLFEKERTWKNESWLGMSICKFPFDVFIFQEIIVKVKPDYIIETGTSFGGSALFYASILELLGHGQVITIDIEDKVDKNIFADPIIKKLFKKRIVRFTGDSSDKRNFKKISDISSGKKNIVFLDSWHSKEHVLKELNLYSKLVPLSSYVVVEDTHANGHPVDWGWGEGPYEAVQEFLKNNETFAIDVSWEKLLITYNPNGFLKKVMHG